MEKRKSFDAVGMVRQIRDGHYEQTKNMTSEERLAFYQEEGRKAQEEGRKAQEELERLAEQISKHKA